MKGCKSHLQNTRKFRRPWKNYLKITIKIQFNGNGQRSSGTPNQLRTSDFWEREEIIAGTAEMLRKKIVVSME